MISWMAEEKRWESMTELISWMAEEKRWESMTELMYQDTKDFAVQFIEEQTPVFKEYQLGLYK